MADGNLVRQSNVGKDSVVFGPTVYDVSLLPYEKELIKTIGITEEEYRKFAAEVRRKGLVRPAEYEHLPDVQASGLEPYLIQIAISLVLTGVAYLLTPKPKMPEASKRTQLDLGSVNAAGRFTPSRGFDTLNELADYGSPIPIIFGLYNEAKDVGGMLITPKLVWSRMFSHGTQQSAKLMFVVGEQGRAAEGIAPDGIAPPDLEGIFLGNNALDALYEDFFAFYWKRNSPIKGVVDSASGFTRLRLKNLLYGTAGKVSNGDPGEYSGPDEDVFRCPSNQEDKSEGFCHAFSPSNNTQFGVYGAIPNGTNHRVNYELVTIIDGTEEKQVRVSVLRRIKIVGAKGEDVDPGDEDALERIRKQRMEGTGRNHSPRMGIVSLFKTDGSTERVDGSTELSETQRVREGDIVEFVIYPTSIPEDKYQRSNNRGGEPVDDINSAVESEQIAADEAMQIGEQFAIANTNWVVISRSLERFDPDLDDIQRIKLRCIDNDESRQQVIGLVSEGNVVNPAQDFIDDGPGVGAGFFPITRVAAGLVRNNRPAVVTEIGIRSKVFQRLNGLCAFNSTPTPSELRRYEDEEVQVRSGTYTGTIMRSSVFQVFVREAGVDSNGDAFKFQRIDLYFVVRGSKPVDQYNFIRFTHPRTVSKELEYKFVGIPASELRALSEDQDMILLSASTSETKQRIIQKNPNVPGLGEFEVETAGHKIKKRNIDRNKEFLRKPVTVVDPASSSIPTAVKAQEVLPQAPSGTRDRAISMRFDKVFGNGTVGRSGAFLHEIFGNADSASGSVGARRSKETLEVFGDKWLRVNWTVEKFELSPDHYARVNNGITHAWSAVSADIIGSNPGFFEGETVTFKRGTGATSGTDAAYGSSNPFRSNHPTETNLQSSGFSYKINDIAEAPAGAGRQGGYFYELFGDASNLAVGSTNSTTRSMTKGSKKLKIKITVQVTELPEDHFSGLKKRWDFAKPIEVVNDAGTNDGWVKGDTVEDTVTISAGSNPFYWTFGSVGYRYLINDIEETPASSITTGATVFESQSQYADLSLYRGLVQKSNESEPEHSIVYVNEILSNQKMPEYGALTLAGLSLKASRNFTSLDQMRCWIGSGLHVTRLHPDYNASEGNPYEESDSLTYRQQLGPSNLFTDLVYYLLTNGIAGAGNLLNMTAANPSLLNADDFEETSRFIHKQELFFNGVIAERTNLRQYITDTAPYFLCNFVIMDGKFSLLPAIPHHPASGEINDGPVVIDQLFTAGNILEDSYKLEYLRSEERRNFKAVVRYRHESKNKLPEERAIEVRLKEDKDRVTDLPQEQFDLTQFCTSRSHAVKVAKYFLGIRKLVTHTISFSTTVHGLNLRAGSYIKVITSSSPYSSANNGTISSSGAVTSVEELADGTHDVTFFKTGSDDVEDAQMQVSGGQVADSKFHDSVFTIRNEKVAQNIYVVEQLTFSQEGTVDIVASEHPCDSDEVSELAKLIVDSSSVFVEEN